MVKYGKYGKYGKYDKYGKYGLVSQIQALRTFLLASSGPCHMNLVALSHISKILRPLTPSQETGFPNFS